MIVSLKQVEPPMEKVTSGLYIQLARRTSRKVILAAGRRRER
jgi:hypothetical protein